MQHAAGERGGDRTQTEAGVQAWTI